MRNRRRIAAVVVVVGVVAGCGSSSSDDATGTSGEATSPTVAAATTAAAAATTDPIEVSTTAGTTVAPTEAPTTTVPGPGASELALAEFLAAYDGLTTVVQAVTSDVQAAIAASGSIDDALYERTDAVAGEVYRLPELVPVGLDPTVDLAVHDAVITMGQAVGAFLFAPGWTTDEWPDWTVGMTAAQAQLPTMRAAVVAAAVAAPALGVVAPGSRDEAAHSVLKLELARTFGHGGPGLELDSVPAVVRWIGALPDGVVSGTDCYQDVETGTMRAPTGDFVDGVGGCAIVFYDGDLAGHEAEVTAWLADPNVEFPGGEFVAFVLSEGTWDPIGSVE